MTAIKDLDFSALLTYEPQLPCLELECRDTICDQTTQTDERNIIDLKAIECDLLTLLNETRELERELKLRRHMLVAKFDSKLRERSVELSRSCDQRLSDLQTRHQEELDTLRDSFKTQLRDGLQLIAAEYKRYYEDLTAGDGKGQESKLAGLRRESSALSERILELESELTLERKEKAQLKRELNEASAKQEYQPWEVPDQIPVEDTGGMGEEEGIQLRGEIVRLEEKIEHLQEEVRDKELMCRKLEGKIESVQADVKKERKEKDKIQNEFQAFRKKTETDTARSSTEASREISSMQLKAREELEKARVDSSQDSQSVTEEIRMKERAKMQLEVKKVQEELDKVRKEHKNLLKQDFNTALMEAQEKEKEYKKTIDSLSKDLNRSNRTWAKKHQILEAQLHAIKDESYIRHSLEKKASNLHQATLAYASEADTHSLPNYPFLPCTLGTLSKQKY